MPLAAWLFSLPMPAGQGWETSPTGPTLWWVIPVLLGLLVLAMPAALGLLHDRYVLAFECTDSGRWQLTTWLLWGRRTRLLAPESLFGAHLVDVEGRFDSHWTPSVDAPYLRVRLPSGRRLIFDAQGEAPHGWPVVLAAFGPPQPRP